MFCESVEQVDAQFLIYRGKIKLPDLINSFFLVKVL